MLEMFELIGGFVEKVDTKLKEKCKAKKGFYELDQFMNKSYGLQVYFRYPYMKITKCGELVKFGFEYEVEIRKWDKNQNKYTVIYHTTPLYVISNDDVMGDDEVESCCNYFLEFFTSLAQRSPEIAFLNKTKKGA